MMCAAGSCINKELPLSEESEQIMERRCRWRTGANITLALWDMIPITGAVRQAPRRIRSLISPPATPLRSIWRALRKYPDVVIKDRLDGTDILWDVVQPPDSFNARSFNFV